MDISASTVLVTGANRGFGRALAAELLDRGATALMAGAPVTQSPRTPRPTPSGQNRSTR